MLIIKSFQQSLHLSLTLSLQLTFAVCGKSNDATRKRFPICERWFATARKRLSQGTFSLTPLLVLFFSSTLLLPFLFPSVSPFASLSLSLFPSVTAPWSHIAQWESKSWWTKAPVRQRLSKKWINYAATPRKARRKGGEGKRTCFGGDKGEGRRGRGSRGRGGR